MICVGEGEKIRKISYGMIVHPSFLGFLGTPHPKNPLRDALINQVSLFTWGTLMLSLRSFFIAFACLPAEAIAQGRASGASCCNCTRQRLTYVSSCSMIVRLSVAGSGEGIPVFTTTTPPPWCFVSVLSVMPSACLPYQTV